MACQRGDQDESWLENTPTMGLDFFHWERFKREQW